MNVSQEKRWQCNNKITWKHWKAKAIILRSVINQTSAYSVIQIGPKHLEDAKSRKAVINGSLLPSCLSKQPLIIKAAVCFEHWWPQRIPHYHSVVLQGCINKNATAQATEKCTGESRQPNQDKMHIAENKITAAALSSMHQTRFPSPRAPRKKLIL